VLSNCTHLDWKECNLAKGDPKHWSTRDGRLYLDYSKSVHDQWLEDPDGFILQANEKWPKVLE